jgi:hypothetical protein
MAPLPPPAPEEPAENDYLLEIGLVWSTLASRLIGDPHHDHAVIAGFSEAFQIPVRTVINKVRMHFRPGNGMVH